MQEVKGIVLSGGIYPQKVLKADIMEKNSKAITKALEQFSKAIDNEKPVKPTLFKLVIFRMTRSSMKYFDEALVPDRKYFETKGWLDSDYYYDVEINPIKKFIGKFFDMMVKRMANKQISNQ